MDKNKQEKLREIGYTIRQTCGNCIRGALSLYPNKEWGTCEEHTYKHRKHTGEDRQLSINRAGWCPMWAGPAPRLNETWVEFYEQ